MLLNELRKLDDVSYSLVCVAHNDARYDGDELADAVSLGSLELARILLSRGPSGNFVFPKVVANVAAYDNEPFRWACGDGHIEIVKLLLKKDAAGNYIFPQVVANVAAYDNNDFRLACGNGHIDIVKLLLEQDSSGNFVFPQVVQVIRKDINKALLPAARGGDVILRYLLSHAFLGCCFHKSHEKFFDKASRIYFPYYVMDRLATFL